MLSHLGRKAIFKGHGQKEAPEKAWKLMSTPLNMAKRDRLFGHAMPANATACQLCYKRAELAPNAESDRRQALQVILGPESDDRVRSQMVRFFGPMPDVVISAFAAWVTLRFWLGMDEAGDRRRQHADIWFVNGKHEGGRVHYDTGMVQIMPGFVQMLVHFAGSVKQIIQPLATVDGFWSAVVNVFDSVACSTPLSMAPASLGSIARLKLHDSGYSAVAQLSGATKSHLNIWITIDCSGKVCGKTWTEPYIIAMVQGYPLEKLDFFRKQ